jgi:hypothetical protein
VSLRADLRLGVAERFHVRAEWRERLALSSGVVHGADGLVPAEPWRAPEPGELDLLLAPSQPEGGVGDAARGQLLALPRHLREAFWDEAGAATVDASAATAFAPPTEALSGFAAALVDFLCFKDVPLPEGALCAVLAAREGSPTTRRDPRSGEPRGLEFDRECRDVGRLRLAANLGDEPTFLTLLNLTAPALGAASDSIAPLDRLGAAAPCGLDPTSLRRLRVAFFAAEPRYPLLRVRLEPGEGLLLPALDVVTDGWTLGQSEPQLLAVVRERCGAPPTLP